WPSMVERRLRLPAARDALTAQYGVSKVTVQRALETLRASMRRYSTSLAEPMAMTASAMLHIDRRQPRPDHKRADRQHAAEVHPLAQGTAHDGRQQTGAAGIAPQHGEHQPRAG